MFKFDNLREVHLEITNRCQAACPMCPRNIHGGIENPLLKINDWTYDDFIGIFNKQVVQQVTSYIFCGNFGDPVLNKDLVKMCEYITTHNPSAAVSIHTNGSLRKPEWWADLVNALPNNHQIVFALDGLADTQALYRVGTDFDKIIANAKALISAGGRAVWHFIRFKHNEHQLEQCKVLAKELGFVDFITKNTRRFTNSNFKVVDYEGTVTHLLEPTTDNIIEFVDRKHLEKTYPKWSTSTDIHCMALNDASLYIDAHFTAMPCCILASWLYTSYDTAILERNGLYDETTTVDIMGAKVKEQVYELVDELGGLSAIDVKVHGIQSIIESPTWQTIWQDKWQNGGSLSCSLMCSSSSPFIPLQKQKIND